MFAKRYLQSDPLGSTDDKILTGLAPLDNILVLIEPVTWEKYPAKKCMLQTIDSILSAAKSIGSPIVNPTGAIYYRMETHYAQFDERTLRRFLKAGASHSGIPHSVFRIAEFIKETMEQFWHDTEDENKVEEPTGAYINLKNGTLFFDREGLRFEVHSPERFIRHCLNFDYDPKATAPLWQKHLDRSLPHPDMQMYLAKCLALTFYGGRIEKAPIFYGQNDTGKSTTLNVFEAMVGSENVSAESLAALTKADYTGDYSRARLDGRLVNIASDISKMINDTGRAKILISRDRISARHPYGDLFDMKDNYARLMFAMNELPSQFFSDAALTKRVAIVPFDQQIRPEDIDTNFTENIIANELPGVLNWVITGLDQLLLTCRLDQPPCCKEVMERIRNENDPLAGWLEERRRCPGDTYDLALQDVYEDFEWYCRQNRHIAPSKKTFIVRLRDVGYRVERPNHHTPLRLYFAAPPSPEN
jgi:putative DNA primase/helicase